MMQGAQAMAGAAGQAVGGMAGEQVMQQ